ncbi:MAG TPA: chaperonin GroEL [Planctomycetota bacterium]|jgi:chaperonin GroEL|nr:chaperonin GroEL [Planctomycetota bacterium]MDP7246122.1 chaperonin GroEL [Planctomycetota bacterium]HJM39309.1 chaperonin GroEL [Planctomycetota bacterium]|tara:strand:+ start:44937 stop:46553 length:1617 start_codon:yes stop_codon:yes gene_type:complete
MPKELSFDVDARDAVSKGVEKLATAVVSTLGPKGRCAVLDKSWGGPTVTKDGHSVAKEIELQDKAENLGAQLVREAASKTSDRAGDGTTTATLLAWSIFKKAQRHLSVGASPTGMIRGMRSALAEVKEYLNNNSTTLNSNDDIRAVATIASNNDSAVGAILADAFEKVGQDGVITIDEGRSLDTEVTIVEGMQFDRGFLSPHFATNQDTLEAVLESPLILVYEDKISSAQDLLPLLEEAKNQNKTLLIVAEDIEGEALATLVLNKMRGIVNVCAVKAPGYGDRRKEMLRDIATLTASEPFMKDTGADLKTVQFDSLGTAKRVLINNNDTTIIEGAGNASDVEARANLIRRQVEETTSDYDREKLEERLAKLVGGIAEVRVGGATETEVKEKKARFVDAKNATQAAIAEGILPGGGVALLRASTVIDSSGTGDEALGRSILAWALTQPTRAIAENSGEDGSVIQHKILANDSFSFGWNALTGEFGDLMKLGVIDPVKVTGTALENAVSVASTLVTTDCVITEIPEKNSMPEGSDFEGDF